MENRNEIFDYCAFISYKGSDEKWAKWLQNKLAEYKLPVSICSKHHNMPRKLKPCFRYHTDILPNILHEELKEQLSKSQFLIVICSKEAVKSDWVGEEIRIFCEELHRENYVIPFIIDGTPYSEDEKECYHQVLKTKYPRNAILAQDKELLGVNINEEGKNSRWHKRERAVLQIVSRILNISFDELWNRQARRIRIRRRCGVAICLLTVILCAFIFDYYRIKYDYYSDYVVEKGMPRGIIPLSRRDIVHRQNYYRFESSQGKLNRVVYADVYGNPHDHHNTAMRDRYAIQKIGYENNVFTSVTMCNALEKPICKEVYNTPDYNKVDLKDLVTGDAANLLNSYTSISLQSDENMFCINSFWQSGKAQIGRYVLDFDSDGYIKRKMFKRYNGDNAHAGKDANGICGIEYIRDSLHRVAEMYYLDQYDKYTEDKHGVAGRKYQYDRWGNITCEDFIDLNGNLTLNEYFYARGVSTTDAINSYIEETFYGADGRPCINLYGFHRSLYTFNDFEMQVSFFGIDDKPVLYWDKEKNEAGYHLVKSTFDRKGHICKMSFMGTDSLPCYLVSGICNVEYETDNKGQVTRFVNYGIDGERVNTYTGVCELRNKYDDYGNQIEITAFGSNGRRVNTIMGYSRIISKFSDNRLVESCYYDYNDIPTNSLDVLNTSGIQIEYDDMSKNPCIVRFLGIDGKLTMCSRNFAYGTLRYDQNGNCVEMGSYDTDGKLVKTIDGFACIKKEYSPDGRLIKDCYYDENMRLTCTTLGNAVAEYDYDKNGMPIEVRMYDENKQLKSNIQGWAIQKSDYKNGLLVSNTYFDILRNPIIATSVGAHQCRYEYNERGYLVAMSFWDVNGNRSMNSNTGIWKMEYHRNMRGQIIEEIGFDIYNRIVTNKYGIARSKYTYNERGFITRLAFYDERGNLCTNKDANFGYAFMTNKINKRGFTEESSVFDAEGNPIDNPVGIHKTVSKMNNNGSLLIRAFYDKDGYLKQGWMGNRYSAMVKFLYNEQGDTYSEIYYNENHEVSACYYCDLNSDGSTNAYFIRDNGWSVREITRDGTTINHYPPLDFGFLNEEDTQKKAALDSLMQLLDSIENIASTMYE